MEIIKQGNGEKFELDITCEVVKDELGLTYDGDKEHCGSVLRINKDDLIFWHWTKYLMQAEGDDYLVKCPICGCRIYVKPSSLPGWVKSYVRNKYK